MTTTMHSYTFSLRSSGNAAEIERQAHLEAVKYYGDIPFVIADLDVSDRCDNDYASRNVVVHTYNLASQKAYAL